MKPFTIEQAAQAVRGTYHGDTALLGHSVTGVAIDDRAVVPGGLFVPIVGERLDGHAFVPAAFHAGAAVCLSAHPLPQQPYILVKDTLDALQRLAKFYRDTLPLRVVGITGSAGKTTTKELVASVLSQVFNTMKTEGNLNNQTGVPLTVFAMEEHHQAAVVEMGTNHFGEIDAVAHIVTPDICVLTNIGTAHIEHLGTREGILRAKCEMLAHMRPGGSVVVHGDDDMLSTLRNRDDVTTFGIQPHNDVYATDVQQDALRGMSFTVHHAGGSFAAVVPSPGEYMVTNALCAAAVGLRMGMDGQAIAQGIAAYRPVGGRMAVHTAHGITVLDDTYNANPHSMRCALQVLAQADGRRVAILGDMYELGSDTALYHAQVGAHAVAAADTVLCVGELAQHMAVEGAEWFATQAELLAALPRHIREGDTVLVKASRGMRLEGVVQALLAGV